MLLLPKVGGELASQRGATRGITSRKTPGPGALLACLALCLPHLCLGALTWPTQRVSLTTKPDDKEAIGIFHFTNSGDTPITITAVQSSCGCTTATLEKRSYASGESGEIKAIFTLGDRVGDQEKTISILTDESRGAPTTLVLHVTIPELLRYSPRLLIWNIGGETGEKTTTISTHAGYTLTAVEIPAPPPKELSVRVELVEAGAQYRLVVRPVSTAQVMNVSFDCVARFTDGSTRHFKIYNLVR